MIHQGGVSWVKLRLDLLPAIYQSLYPVVQIVTQWELKDYGQ
jgi:hypothetical protein